MTRAAPAGSHPASLPLAGRRIMLTRPHDQAGDFEACVSALGGTPVVAPAIAITEPLSWAAADQTLGRLADFDWIAFTSANAVRAFVNRARHLGIDPVTIGRQPIAAVGPMTAAALAAGVRQPDVVASLHGSSSLAYLIPVSRDSRVLFPRAAAALDVLPAILRAHGATVVDVAVYRTIAGEGVRTIAEALRFGRADAVLFASPSAVSFAAQALDDLGPPEHATTAVRSAVFCLGPTTEAAARTVGFEPATTARAATLEELIDAVARWFMASTGPATPTR